jgi:hypothetical protein
MLHAGTLSFDTLLLSVTHLTSSFLLISTLYSVKLSFSFSFGVNSFRILKVIHFSFHSVFQWRQVSDKSRLRVRHISLYLLINGGRSCEKRKQR